MLSKSVITYCVDRYCCIYVYVFLYISLSWISAKKHVDDI